MGTAILDSEKAEALVNSLKEHFQVVNNPLDLEVIETADMVLQA